MDDFDETELVCKSLQESARMLAAEVNAGDNLYALFGVLLTLKYYSTTASYAEFFISLPEEAQQALAREPVITFNETESGLSVTIPTDSALAVNMQLIGAKAVMGMVALRCDTIEDVINLAYEAKMNKAH